MRFRLTQNNTLGFFSFPPKQKKKKEKRPFLSLWPNPVLFLSIFQLSPWTETAIIFSGLSRGHILCFVPPCHAIRGQTQSERQSCAPSGQTEPSGALFSLNLNFYIRSESVLSRLPDSRISGESKMLNADTVFTRVCEAGGVRGICSYLISFLTLSHSLCGFGKSICSCGSVSLTPEQKQTLSAQQAAVPARGCALLKTAH